MTDFAPFERVNSSKLGEIIRAAGKEPDSADDLLSELQGAASLYWAAREAKQAGANEARLNKIIGRVRDLQDMVRDDMRLVRHVSGLSRLIEDVEALKAMPEGLEAALGLGRMSAFENLIATLMAIYRSRFSAEPGYTRDAGEAQIRGPFVEFASKALDAMSVQLPDKPYSYDSIAAAITKANRLNVETLRVS